MPTVAESTSQPPDEPPGATAAEASSAVLAVVYTDAVTPVSTMNPTKTAKTAPKNKVRRQVRDVESDEHTALESVAV
jgi:hypothetical protein